MSDQEPTISAEVLLQRAPLFSRLSRRNLQKLAHICVPRSYPAGELVIEEGSTGLGLFVVATGRLEVFMNEGGTRITLAEMGAGDILGEMALIDDQPRSASAITLEPTECLLITRGSFQSLVKKDPEIAWCIVTPLAERLRDLQRRIIEGEGLEPASTAPDVTEPVGEEPVGDEPERSQRPEKSKGADPLLLPALRAQYALTMAGVTGLIGSVRVMEKFFSSLADTTDLSSRRDVGGLLRELPRAMIEATEAAFGEAEQLPERMLSRFRRERP